MFALKNLFVSGDLIEYVEKKWPTLNTFQKPVLLDELESCVRKHGVRGLENYIARKRNEIREADNRVKSQLDELFAAMK